MRLLRPLRQMEMALLWGGLSLSAIGDQLYAVALSWIAVSVFGAAAGYLTALQSGVLLLALIGVGRWSERWDAATSLIGADLVRAATLAALVLLWLARGQAEALPLVVAIVVLAAGQAVFQPALQVVLPHAVPDRAMLPAANALMDATDRSARLLGPGLVALLAGVLPVVHFLSVDAATFLASAAAVAAIRRRRPMTPVRRQAAEGVWPGLVRGARAMSRHRLLGYVLRTTALVNGAWGAVYFFALPLLIERAGIRGPGGSGLGAFGLVIACYGATSVAANLLLGGRPVPDRPQWQMFGGSLLVGAGTVLLALSGLLPPGQALPALAASAALSSIGGPMKDIPVAVLRQTEIATADLAASMRCYLAASSGGMLLALVLTPTLVRAIGTVPLIAACGVVMIGTATVALVRFRDWPGDAPGRP